jgi:arginase
MSDMRKIGIIGVPSSAGARQSGQERSPQSFRQAGLIEKLRSSGLEVNDFGDLPQVSFEPDQQNPNSQNLPLVVEVTKQVAKQVENAIGDDIIPIVLGGDCTITLGVLIALINHTPKLGLLYFDGDLDLNTPDTTTSGIFDGMVMAHITGKGDEQLSHSGPRYPLMTEEDIVLFGYNTESGWIDAVEMERLQQCEMLKYPVSQIKGKAKESARDALSQLEKKADNILVHFDVDVIDYDEFPVADVPHSEGLSFDEAMSALEVFLASPKLTALVITEFNANRDSDGLYAQQFVNAVATALHVKGG